MSEKVHVTVYRGEEYSADFPQYDWIAPKVLAWLTEKIEEIPTEFRDSSWCRISSETSYDSSQATIEIGYERPETAEETAKRLAEKAATKRAKEMNERALYEQLRKKFEQR